MPNARPAPLLLRVDVPARYAAFLSAMVQEPLVLDDEPPPSRPAFAEVLASV